MAQPSFNQDAKLIHATLRDHGEKLEDLYNKTNENTVAIAVGRVKDRLSSLIIGAGGALIMYLLVKLIDGAKAVSPAVGP